MSKCVTEDHTAEVREEVSHRYTYNLIQHLLQASILLMEKPLHKKSIFLPLINASKMREIS